MSARPHLHVLGDASEWAVFVVEDSGGHADAVGADGGFGGDSGPVACGLAEQVHGQVGVEEQPVCGVEFGSDAVGDVGDGEESFEGGEGFSFDEVEAGMDMRRTVRVLRTGSRCASRGCRCSR